MRVRTSVAAAGCPLLLGVVFGVLSVAHGAGPHQASVEAAGREMAGAERYDTAALRADFRELRQSLEQHPALYALTDKAAFDRLFDETAARIDHPMTVPEFYRLVAPIVARIGCGHTAVRAPFGYWTPPAGRFLPIRFAFVGNRAYVHRIAGSAGFIPPGSEVLAINGVPTPEIFARLKAAVSFDVEAGRTAVLGTRMLHELYALLVGTPEKFDVAFVAPGRTAREEVRLAAIGLDTLLDLTSDAARATSTGDPRLDFTIDRAAGTAVLTIRSFGYYDDRSAFNAFIDRAFDAVRSAGVGHLIVDLRGNSGGDPFCTAYLLAHLASAPVPYFGRVYRGYEALSRPIPLSAKRFSGRLSVLIDGLCFSSTGHLCALLKYHHTGRFIGSETAATYECNDASQESTLRYTGLRLRVARRTYTAAVQNMPRRTGIVPDDAVANTLEDVLKGRDAVLEYARRH